MPKKKNTKKQNKKKPRKKGGPKKKPKKQKPTEPGSTASAISGYFCLQCESPDLIVEKTYTLLSEIEHEYGCHCEELVEENDGVALLVVDEEVEVGRVSKGRVDSDGRFCLDEEQASSGEVTTSEAEYDEHCEWCLDSFPCKPFCRSTLQEDVIHEVLCTDCGYVLPDDCVEVDSDIDGRGQIAWTNPLLVIAHAAEGRGS